MAFKPTLNSVSKFQEAQTSKNLIEEIKEKQQVNHKSNVFKILKNNPSLTRDECIELTKQIDEYYKDYLR